ncbi:glycosyltransferase [Flavobacterium plurextorum]|uniref:glycosyltransferase family 2 protein n=1 Tax=Flavobacterium TaxID=237 RepID=UPI00214D7A0D|nr:MULTISPECIES: glycosyltransferase [Flavobacterium]UUW11454.1 glycosyltransferase [Flavobacterium plurextorum]
MLSILIPVYNQNVLSLVNELVKQCSFCGIHFEIIAQDDASNSVLNKENESINSLQNSSFISLEKNIGLSSNRNLLVSKAKYENLLFIDGDSIIINSRFIQNYLDNTSFDIVYGGRIHPLKVESKEQKLRWKYGRLIEDKTVSQRNSSVFKTLMFNNTLIKKDCFNTIQFDADLTKYGHEDTLFAFQVSKSNFSVKHIDNAVEHGEIDSSKTYLSKVKNSLENLIVLDQKKQIDPSFVKILYAHNLLKKYKLKFTLGLFYSAFNRIIYKQLNSNNPSLTLLNVFKISYICSLK